MPDAVHLVKSRGPRDSHLAILSCRSGWLASLNSSHTSSVLGGDQRRHGDVSSELVSGRDDVSDDSIEEVEILFRSCSAERQQHVFGSDTRVRPKDFYQCTHVGR